MYCWIIIYDMYRADVYLMLRRPITLAFTQEQALCVRLFYRKYVFLNAYSKLQIMTAISIESL